MSEQYPKWSCELQEKLWKGKYSWFRLICEYEPGRFIDEPFACTTGYGLVIVLYQRIRKMVEQIDG
jgi:hypothetical protein